MEKFNLLLLARVQSISTMQLVNFYVLLNILQLDYI